MSADEWASDDPVAPDEWASDEPIPSPLPSGGRRQDRPEPRRCTAMSKQAKRRCRRWATPGRTTCKFHGGRSLRGAAHPAHRGKGYSTALPTRLADHYRRSVDDPDQLSLVAELGLIDARIMDLVEGLSRGDTPAQLKALAEAAREFKKARKAVDPDAMRAAGSVMAELALEGAKVVDSWEALFRAIQNRRRVAESERKRLVEASEVVSKTSALALVAYVADSIRRHVSDRVERSLILEDLALMLEAREHEAGRAVQAVDAEPDAIEVLAR